MWLLLGVLAFAGAAGAIAQRLEADLSRPLSLRGLDYGGSSTCRSCHPGQHRSWHARFIAR